MTKKIKNENVVFDLDNNILFTSMGKVYATFVGSLDAKNETIS